MAYIVVTNPNQIVSFNTAGDLGTIWYATYVASILVAVIGTLLMAFYAKMPFAQACGMGLNSFFFVSFILPALLTGGDVVKGYQEGLLIILLSGVIFMILSVTGLRVKTLEFLHTLCPFFLINVVRSKQLSFRVIRREHLCSRVLPSGQAYPCNIRIASGAFSSSAGIGSALFQGDSQTYRTCSPSGRNP